MEHFSKKEIFKTLFLIFTILVFLGAFLKNVHTSVILFSLPTVLLFLSLVMLAFIIFAIFSKKIEQKKLLFIIVVILTIIFGIILRLLSMKFFNTIQVSDFANSEKLYDFLQNDSFHFHKNTLNNNQLQNNFALFPTWGFYSYIIVSLYKIFGFSVGLVKYLNILLYVLSSIFIYFGARNIFSKRVGLISIFIFAIAPTLVVYNNVASPDHFTILLMSIVIFLWSLLLNNSVKQNIKWKYIISIVLILFMSLVNLFKPLSIYMLLVFICTEIIINAFSRKEKNYFRNNWKYLLFFILAFLLINTVCTKAMNNYVENKIKMSIKDSSSLYLLWGYSLNEQKNYDSNYIYFQIMGDLAEKYNNNYELILKDVDQIAKKNLKNNIKYLPKIWNSKFGIAFKLENNYIDFANTGNNKNDIANNSYDNIVNVSNCFMAINYLMIIITCCALLKNKCEEKGSIILLLMIIGFISILILGGVQSRYKIIISPQLFIVYALGLVFLLDNLKYLLLKWRKRK